MEKKQYGHPDGRDGLTFMVGSQVLASTGKVFDGEISAYLWKGWKAGSNEGLERVSLFVFCTVGVVLLARSRRDRRWWSQMGVQQHFRVYALLCSSMGCLATQCPLMSRQPVDMISSIRWQDRDLMKHFVDEWIG